MLTSGSQEERISMLKLALAHKGVVWDEPATVPPKHTSNVAATNTTPSAPSTDPPDLTVANGDEPEDDGGLHL
jgi:hypothetical protein